MNDTCTPTNARVAIRRNDAKMPSPVMTPSRILRDRPVANVVVIQPRTAYDRVKSLICKLTGTHEFRNNVCLVCKTTRERRRRLRT